MTGMLNWRYGILLAPIRADIKNAVKFVLACIALHSYLMETDSDKYLHSGFAGG